MAFVECQLLLSHFLQAVEQALQSALYSAPISLPFDQIVVNSLTVGAIGSPALTGTVMVQTVTTNVYGIRVPVAIGVARVADVIAAKGGAAPDAVDPTKTQLVVLVSAAMTNAKGVTSLDVSYDQIDQTDPGYQALLNLVAIEVYGGDKTAAQAQFDTWESTFRQSPVGSKPLLTIDLAAIVPPSVTAVLALGAAGVSVNLGATATPLALAIRCDLGPAPSTVTEWSEFNQGVFPDRLEGSDWGLFVSADAIVTMVDTTMAQAITSFGGTFSAPSSAWAPQNGIARVTSTVDGTAPVPLNTVFGSAHIDVSLALAFQTTFTFVQTGPVPQLRTSISYSYQVGAGGIVDILVHDFFTPPTPPGFVSDGTASFHQDTRMPPVVLPPGEATLEVTGVRGLVDGVAIVGDLIPAHASVAPDISVLSVPFQWEYVTTCQDLRNHRQLPVGQGADALATFYVMNSGDPFQAPFVISEFLLVTSDPNAPSADQYGIFASFVPDVPLSPGNFFQFEVRVPVSALAANIAYQVFPYPMELVVVTTGGARYLSLGEFAPFTSQNVKAVYIPDCDDSPAYRGPAFVVAILQGDPSPDGPVESVGDREVQIAEAIARALLQTTAGGQTTIAGANGQPVATLTIGQLTPGRAMQPAVKVIGSLMQGLAGAPRAAGSD
jgi:hypothetical protein